MSKVDERLRWIDAALLDDLSDRAAKNPRRRLHYNFHHDSKDPAHRLLNAIAPDSYIPPHCHLDKDETLLLVQGRLGVLIFDTTGSISSLKVLQTGGALGVDIPRGVFHSFVALDTIAIVLECKAGPYQPLRPEELAPWAVDAADRENAAAQWQAWQQLFRSLPDGHAR